MKRSVGRESSRFLISVVRDIKEDSRNRIVAIGMPYDRAWGKAKEMPAIESSQGPRGGTPAIQISPRAVV